MAGRIVEVVMSGLHFRSVIHTSDDVRVINISKNKRSEQVASLVLTQMTR